MSQIFEVRAVVVSDVLARVGVFHQRRATAVVLIVRQARDHHAPGQGISGVWTDDAAALGDEIGDDLVQSGLGQVAVHVEDEDLVGIQPTGPEIVAVVGEAGVVGLVAVAYR